MVWAGDVNEGVIQFVGKVEAERLKITKNDRVSQVSKKYKDGGRETTGVPLQEEAGGSIRINTC